MVWNNLRGKITIRPDGKAAVNVTEGRICGVTTTGILRKAPEPVLITVAAGKPVKQNLSDFFGCIGLEKKYLTGRYLLNAQIGGTPGNWETGHIMLEAEKGVMKEMSVLSKVLTLINVSELFSVDKLSHIFSKGYPYTTLKFAGDISGNRLHIKNAYVIGDGLDFFISGSAGLSDRTLDLIVYVKPLKTIDSLIAKIPLVGKKLEGREKGVAFIPIQIKGDLDHPDVAIYMGRYLDADKRYVMDFLKRTLSLPSKMIDAK